jgi:hypothetical protein
MSKRKFFRGDLLEMISREDRISVNILNRELVFEIGQEIITDVAEAVAILMTKVDNDDPIWNTEIQGLKIGNITPERALFWLTGGTTEWRKKHSYIRDWHDCFMDYNERFGHIIVDLVHKSKKLGDIRDFFRKELNLLTLYDFAISKKIIR